MMSRTSCRGVPEFSAPEWTFPIPMGPKRSTPVAQFLSPCSFDVLYLLPKFFDFRFYFQRESGDGQRFAFDARRFGEHGIGFTMHLLQEKIQFFAEFACAIEQLSELLHMTSQTVQFFADIAAFRKYGCFLRK